jgi:hypothetical protein
VQQETLPEPPPPPPDEQMPPKGPPEDVWKEDYEGLITPEKPPRKPRHIPWGGIVLTAAIIIFLVSWTVLSPEVMPQEGDTYTSSPVHASWGNYTGYRDIWAGNMTWGVSISGHATSQGNESVELTVLITKVYERTGNWFFRGTAIDLRNVSVFMGSLDNATYLASMSNKTDKGYGVAAEVPVTFPGPGVYELFVSAKFMVYEVMRIGFIPLESVLVEAVYLDFQIVVS